MRKNELIYWGNCQVHHWDLFFEVLKNKLGPWENTVIAPVPDISWKSLKMSHMGAKVRFRPHLYLLPKI